MGGSDDPENLVEVTAEEHANLHLALYLEHGHREDWFASQAIAGHIGKEEIIRERAVLGGLNPNTRTAEANRKRQNTMMGKNRGPRSDKHKKLIAETTKEAMKNLPQSEYDKMKANGERQGIANRKSYQLLKEDGKTITIVGQQKFCRENKFDWQTLKKYSRLDKYYKGYKIL